VRRGFVCCCWKKKKASKFERTCEAERNSFRNSSSSADIDASCCLGEKWQGKNTHVHGGESTLQLSVLQGLHVDLLVVAFEILTVLPSLLRRRLAAFAKGLRLPVLPLAIALDLDGGGRDDPSGAAYEKSRQDRKGRVSA
jgi:hypothetical protein